MLCLKCGPPAGLPQECLGKQGTAGTSALAGARRRNRERAGRFARSTGATRIMRAKQQALVPARMGWADGGARAGTSLDKSRRRPAPPARDAVSTRFEPAWAFSQRPGGRTQLEITNSTILFVMSSSVSSACDRLRKRGGLSLQSHVTAPCAKPRHEHGRLTVGAWKIAGYSGQISQRHNLLVQDGSTEQLPFSRFRLSRR